MPLVSVIIAAYGRPDYVNEALHSVCAQTFRDFEVILVDDCSGDDVVARYRLPEHAHLIRHEKRFGAAAASRNTGLRAAGGKYIAFLDQDDLWLPKKLEIQVDALERRPEAGLAFCHYTAVDDHLRPLPDQRRPRRKIPDPLKKLITGCCIRTPSTVLARAQDVRECGMFDETIIGASDWDLYLRLARLCAFVAIPERLVLYRMHPEQIHRKSLVMREANLRVMRKTLQWADAERPELRRWVLRWYGRMLRKIGREQLFEEHNSALALNTLRQARRMRPWDVRVHALVARAICSGGDRMAGGTGS